MVRARKDKALIFPLQIKSLAFLFTFQMECANKISFSTDIFRLPKEEKSKVDAYSFIREDLDFPNQRSYRAFCNSLSPSFLSCHVAL